MKSLKFFLWLVVVFAVSFCARCGQTPKVVVVGAGISGLTTAYRLNQKNIDVEVYEARKRVGGRMFSAFTNGHVVELGGQNLVDSSGNKNLMQLIHECGLECIQESVVFDDLYYLNGGKQWLIKDLCKAENLVPETFAQQLTEVRSKTKNMEEVLKHFFSPEGPTYKALEGFLVGYEGGPVTQLSSRYISTLYATVMSLGGFSSFSFSRNDTTEPSCFLQTTIKGGNGLLPQKLASTLGDRVRTDMPLTMIEKNSDGSFLLTFRDGKKISADILVLAVPCSVYKNIAFGVGVIPDDTLTAIKNVHYGTHAKITIPVAGAAQKTGHYLNDQLITFFNAGNTALTLFYRGQAGYFSPLTLAEVYQRDRKYAIMALGEKSVPLQEPTYARDEQLVSYDGPVGYSWPNELYSQGSYSYIAAGQDEILSAMHEETGEKVRTLFAPIDKKLFFVGEHTSIFLDSLGTMEGACESGERVARMIEKNI